MKKWVKYLILALAVCILAVSCFSVPVHAETYSGECGADGDNVTWTLTNGVLTISGTGKMNDNDSVPWSSYMDNITSVVINGGVENIRNYAFSSCSSLTSVNISGSVTSIGVGAFNDCWRLTYINIPDGVMSIGGSAFAKCINLCGINIPSSVESIGSAVLDGCYSLEYIRVAEDNSNYTGKGNCLISKVDGTLIAGCDNSIIPDDGTVTSIGECAFTRRTELTSIKIPESVTSIGEYAFSKCISLTSIAIPNGVTAIARGTFDSCQGLISIYIPESVTSIGNNAFHNCTRLKSIDIPDGVISIGENAFEDCTSLASIDIPDGVTSIENFAFSGCTSLENIDIPDGVTSIGSGSFWNCTNLENIEIPESVTSIGDGIIANGAFDGCTSLKSIEIPKNVTTICSCAFEGCTSLESVGIPDGITTIDYGAFFNCTSLKSVCIPDGVTLIGKNAFRGCTSLTSIDLPDGVNSIEDRAFWGCTSLTNVNIPDGVKSIAIGAFYACSSLTSIFIPNGVTSIGDYAFDGCKVLQEVYYSGTWAEWNSITFGEKNELLIGAIVHTSSQTSYAWSNDGQSCVATHTCSLDNCYETEPVSARISSSVKTDATYTSDGTTTYIASFSKCWAETQTKDVQDIPAQNNTYVFSGFEWNEGNYTAEAVYERAKDSSQKKKYSAMISTEIVNEATCTESGTIKLTAYYDGYSETKIEAIDPRGHNVEHIPYKEAKNGNEGNIEYWYCKRCGKYYADSSLTREISLSDTRIAIYIVGSVNGDDVVTDADALYLLYYTFYPEEYKLNQPADFNGDGVVTDSDALYLLYHTFYPNDYPLEK